MAFNATAQDQSSSDSTSSSTPEKKGPPPREQGEFKKPPFGPHGPGPMDHEGPPIPPEMIEKFDLDKDGKLNPEEMKEARKAMHEMHKEEILKKYDKNGDGKLSDSETERMQADRLKEMKEELLKEYDKNGNGKLDSSEKEKIKEDAKLDPERFQWLNQPGPHPLKEFVK
ncbi:MAG: hypothetical protein V4507_14425 [Verrucomicrobiota bacterium]